MLSIPPPGNTDGKDVFLSYWRDPEILNQTSKASTCFYQCVEPRACLGTLSCNDEEGGTGLFCRERRVLIMNNAKSTNTHDAVPLDNYTTIKSGKTTCIETSSLGDQYCVAARIGEDCARGYTGPACGELFLLSSSSSPLLLSFTFTTTKQLTNFSFYFLLSFSPFIFSFIFSIHFLLPTKKTQPGARQGTPVRGFPSALRAWRSVLQLQWSALG